MRYGIYGVALIFALIAAARAEAADAKPAQREVCVQMQDIQGNDSPAIDDKTIVLRLNGNRFKRVDLENRCSDIVMKGFSYDAPIQALCTSSTLHVNESAGATCLIKDIV